MEFYVHYEDGKTESCTMKVSEELDDSFTINELKKQFENYYAKTTGTALKHKSLKMVDSGKLAINGQELVKNVIENGADVYVMEDKVKLLKCGRFGCLKKYEQKDNNGSACHYHPKPPTFHDTKKGWSCCSNKLVYDWDDFEKIPTCSVGFHQTKEEIAAASKLNEPKPNVAEKEVVVKKSTTAPAEGMKSIDDFNKSNPNAKTAVSSVVQAKKKAPVQRTDGKAKCKNFGCQQLYVVDENTPESCLHHASGPVFHDAGKYWSCCPKQKKYDFDAFLKIPGCARGMHKNS